MKNTIGADLYIYGRLYENDSVYGYKPAKPLAGVEVKIGTDASGLTYIQSVKTDNNGYFVIKNLQNIKYYISAQTTDSSVIYYNLVEKDMSANVPDGSYLFELFPKKTEQNGIVYKVIDEQGNALSGCSVTMYSNLLLANDSNTNGNYWNTATNSYGVATKLNIPQGKYVTYLKIVAGQTIFNATDTVDMKQEGIIYRTKILNLKAPSQTNCIKYYIKDTTGSFIANCNVYGFNSYLLANDSVFTSSNWSATADNTGVAVKKNIPASNYYVVVFNYSTPYIKLKARDTIFNITANTQINDTIVLH